MEDAKYKILLIEDDTLDRIAFERFLQEEKLPYDYTAARSVAEAREILKSRQFDIIVSDYFLGDGTALEILNTVKHTPVILITGAANEQVAIDAWRAGTYDYLPKDLDRNYLKAVPATIEKAVRRRKVEDALDRKQKNLEAIFSAAPVGMLLADENMIVARANDTIMRMLHREHSHLVNQPICRALGCVNSTENDNGCGNIGLTAENTENAEKKIYNTNSAIFAGSAVKANAECLLKNAIDTVLHSGRSVQEIEIHPTLELIPASPGTF